MTDTVLRPCAGHDNNVTNTVLQPCAGHADYDGVTNPQESDEIFQEYDDSEEDIGEK